VSEEKQEEQLVAMKIDRPNLERLVTEWSGMRGLSEFMWQLLKVNTRGETAYLVSVNGRNPFHELANGQRIITGSTLRHLYNYGAPGPGMFWFPIYRRT
jgi:hypothetical protein